MRAANGYDFDAHEFQLTPSGTALLISYVPVAWDLSKLGGRRDGVVEDCVVQEIDVETGELRFEWHALGSIGLGESYRPAPAKQGQMHDPFHVNSVALDSDGNLLVSARHTNASTRSTGTTGDVDLAARRQGEQLRAAAGRARSRSSTTRAAAATARSPCSTTPRRSCRRTASARAASR